MKTLIFLITILIVLSGCNREPAVRVIAKTKVDVVMPNENHTTLYAIPSLDESILTGTPTEVLDKVLVYSIKLQTTIEMYEERTLSLQKWRTDVTEKYTEEYDNVSFK